MGRVATGCWPRRAGRGRGGEKSSRIGSLELRKMRWFRTGRVLDGSAPTA